MSETKWTKGPWRVEDFPYRHIRSVETNECVMAADYSPEANARLIAAAPDLAEALEPFAALAAVFRDEPDDMPVYRPACGPEITLGDLHKARAALARAKGAS